MRYIYNIMKKLTALKYVGFAVLASAALLLPSSALAVEYGGVGGRPANPRADNPRSKSIFIYSLKGGETTTDAVRIYNNTSTPRTIEVYAVDSALATGGAFTCAQQAEKSKDVGNWIALTANRVTVAANGHEDVPFTVTVPRNADVGEHDGCIAIEDASANAPRQEQSGVVLGFRSAIRVAITVPGQIVKKLSISQVRFSHLPNGDIEVAPVVQNDGNVSLDTALHTRLASVLGTSHEYDNGTSPVLPRSKATWNFTIPRPFWGGWYQARVTASYSHNTAVGLGERDSSAPKVISSQTGWIFVMPKPVALAIELAVLAVMGLAVWWLLRHHRQRRTVKRHWSTYRVRSGDTVVSIAKAHGISWKYLARANKLRAPYHLEAEQQLKVPAKDRK